MDVAGRFTARFTGRVAEYERYRLRYPAAAVLDVLRERCGLRAGELVADIGAGTGMLAEVFLEGGCRVVAVEPNAEMRATCERLLGARAGLEIVAASAENTGLAEASVDMVSVGRAFHWFDRERALAEFARILRPGGWVVLVTSRRMQDGSAMAVDYERILEEFGTDYGAVRGAYRSYAGTGEGGFTVRINGEQVLGLEEFLGQTQSYSTVPMPGTVGYEAMQEALRGVFGRWSAEGMLRMGTVCEVVGWRV